MKECESYNSGAVGRLTAVPVMTDPRGCLGFIQEGPEEAGGVPFAIKRVYWCYDVRGRHELSPRAVRGCQELLVVMSGSARVRLDNGCGSRSKYRLIRPDRALLIPEGTWREIDELATNTVLMVLASEPYRPEDVIRNYQDFKNIKND